MSLGVISATVVLTRLSTRLVTTSTFGLDDLFTFITLVAGVPSMVLTAHGEITNGLGRDIWTLSPTAITDFIRVFYAMEILYFIQLALLKSTLLFFYLRIFPGQRIKQIIWGTLVFDLCFGLVFLFLAIFPCEPISYYWTRWDEQHEGQCVDINMMGWVNACISIVLDIWMLGIPISQLVHLKLHWKKKLGVFMMFFVGTFVTVVSIIRLHSLVHFQNSRNPTWDNLSVSIWSTIEINVGLICACMPTLRLLLVHLFPNIMASQNQSGSKNAYYGTPAHSAVGGNISIVRPRGKSLQDDYDTDGDGIRYEQSYTVHHSDHLEQDESKLIEMYAFDSRISTRSPMVNGEARAGV
ncbi:hypothetical protein QTJ16_003327 [Diplocarpon rosae]|uniref:Rhodopsin domain-containing protein n=1 Tax=Diplocarpon rosae TaxID=946125 RepID=A0AAD9WFG4_9HELO|nr:hypothetical protein QTJ16_003327 [Diplocarpon rosae]